MPAITTHTGTGMGAGNLPGVLAPFYAAVALLALPFLEPHRSSALLMLAAALGLFGNVPIWATLLQRMFHQARARRFLLNAGVIGLAAAVAFFFALSWGSDGDQRIGIAYWPWVTAQAIALTALYRRQLSPSGSGGEVAGSWGRSSHAFPVLVLTIAVLASPAFVVWNAERLHKKRQLARAVHAWPAPTPHPPQPSPTPTPTPTPAPWQMLPTVLVQEGKNFVEDFGEGVSLEMVWMPAGTFLMGSPEDEAGRLPDDELQQTTVTLTGFWIGKHEVTQAQWEAMMGARKFAFPGPENPADGILWADALDFCRKLSWLADKTYTLPEESQWEYACRAGTTTPYAFGQTLSPEQANFKEAKNVTLRHEPLPPAKSTQVGSYPPNAWGLHDMHGNMAEWCESYGRQRESSSPFVRGGAWSSFSTDCRSACREFVNLQYSYPWVGFRVIVVHKSTPANL
ncbi:MAG: formylglycine-generating enzyme family protein [Candidatus Sumerlaeaceae bacterium]